MIFVLTIIIRALVSCTVPISSHMTNGIDTDDQQCSKDTKLEVGGGGDRKERACDSLVMCILTTLNQGLRNGGGIGDILRAPSSTVSKNYLKHFWVKLMIYICRKHFL